MAELGSSRTGQEMASVTCLDACSDGFPMLLIATENGSKMIYLTKSILLFFDIWIRVKDI